MISALRKKSVGVVVKSLLILLIISFGAWGIQDWLSPAISGNAIATVGVDEIGAVEVKQRVYQEIARLRPLLGNQFTQAQALNFGIIDGIINEQVDDTLISQGAASLGVSISDKLVSEDIRSQASFKGLAGNFDRELFNQILLSNGLNEANYVKIVRSSLTNKQYTESFLSGTRAPLVMVDAVYRYRNEERIVEIALINDETFVDVGEPNVSQIQAFHKAKAKQFTAPEYRKFSFLSIKAIDLVDEIDVTVEDIQNAYDSRLDEFVSEETRHIWQIVVSDEKKAKKAQLELLSGRDFAIVAKEIAGLDRETLDLGVVNKNDLLPELADQAFSLMKGAVSAPVKSKLGWHLLKVTNIEAGGIKALSEVSNILKKDIAKEKAVDSLYNLSRNLEDELGGGASIEEAASKINFKVTNVAAMDQAGKNLTGKTIEGIPESQVFLQTTFTTEEGEDSQLTEFGQEGFFVVRVDNVIQPTIRPIDTVRTQIIEAWKAEQRGIKSKELAAKMVVDINTGKTLFDVASTFTIVPSTSKAFKRDDRGGVSGLSAKLVEKVFLLKPVEATKGKTSEGYQVVVLKKIIEANPSADKTGVDDVRNTLTFALKADVKAQLTSVLRQKTNVDINRPLINQLFSGEQQTQ